MQSATAGLSINRTRKYGTAGAGMAQRLPFGLSSGARIQAPALARLIEGGLPTEATVAQVLVSKFADHLPLYRQAQIYARQGVALDRSTLADTGAWLQAPRWRARPSCCGPCTSGCSTS